MVDLNMLQAPFAPADHSWRAQSVARDGRRAQALCYINARTVQSRLDLVCGVAGWESSFNETRSGRVIATISIDMGSRWVSKSDGAGATAMEGVKGGLSDAFKRAAVMWGIGRYLYSIPSTWAECEIARDRQGNPQLRNGKPSWRGWTARGQGELDKVLERVLAAHTGRPAAPMALTDQRPAALPAPADDLAALKEALSDETSTWPEEVAELLNGLPRALRDGSYLELWGELYPKVPREWRSYVVGEKDRIKRDMRR
ncbi:MAG: Rad52/Rad22 family DNA repair protein [Pseudomonadota bacterium]|nr:Rad52/Rad22 family DNA repair protein [Pseudomonadota bacterium]